MKIKYIFSLIAGTVSALTIGYLLASSVWGLPYPNEIFATGGIVVMVLSALLSVVTGEKISSKYSQVEMKQSFTDGSVFDNDDLDKTREEIINDLPKGKRSL